MSDSTQERIKTAQKLPVGLKFAKDIHNNELHTIIYHNIEILKQTYVYLHEVTKLIIEALKQEGKNAVDQVLIAIPLNGAAIYSKLLRIELEKEGVDLSLVKFVPTAKLSSVERKEMGEEGEEVETVLRDNGQATYEAAVRDSKERYLAPVIEGEPRNVLVILVEDIYETGKSSRLSLDAIARNLPNSNIRCIATGATTKKNPNVSYDVGAAAQHKNEEGSFIRGTVEFAYNWLIGNGMNGDIIPKEYAVSHPDECALVAVLERLLKRPLVKPDISSTIFPGPDIEQQVQEYIIFLSQNTIFWNKTFEEILDDPIFQAMLELEKQKRADERLELFEQQSKAIES